MPLHQLRVHNMGRALKATLGVGAAGLLVYWASASRVQQLPPDVAELCRKGHALMAAGAPISAAEAYQKAYNLLAATGSDPVHGIDALMWLGNAQDAGKQFARARDSFARAAALCASAERSLPPAYVQRRQIYRKHAVVLDRLADVALFTGDRAGAAEYYSSAVAILHAQYGPLVERAKQAAAAGGGSAQAAFSSDEQRLLTEFGVILLSRASLLLDGRGDGYRARDSAQLAVALLTAAAAGVRAEAEALLAKVGKAGAGGDAAVAAAAGAGAAEGEGGAGGLEVGAAGHRRVAAPAHSGSSAADGAARAYDDADEGTRACMLGLAGLAAATGPGGRRATGATPAPEPPPLASAAGALLTQMAELAALTADARELAQRAGDAAEAEAATAAAKRGGGGGVDRG
jgi:tetratricopeptide (TPR) repeat protein